MSEMPAQDDTHPQLQVPPAEDEFTEEQPYYTYPGRHTPPPPRRRGGIGCWIIGLMTAFMATALIVAGLFLPPVSLGDRLFGDTYAILDAENNAAAHEGLTLIVDPADPGSDFGVALDSVSMSDFAAANRAAGPWVVEASAAVHPFLALQSQVYTIETRGQAPGTVTLTLNMPPEAGNPDVMDLYAWNSARRTWEFLPSQVARDGQIRARVERVPERLALFQAAPYDPIVLSRLDFGESIPAGASELVTIITPTGVQAAMPTAEQQRQNNEQTIGGSLAPGFELNAGYMVMPVIRNYTDARATDVDTVVALISNRALRDRHIQQIVSFASSGGYSGVFIDYRGLPEDQRASYSAFMRQLGQRLSEMNLSLGVVVPMAQNVDGTWQTGAYDWRALGAAATYVQVNLEADPTIFVPGPDRLVEAMMRWAVGEVSRYKLLAGMSALSQREVTGDFTPIGYNEALSALGNVRIEAAASEGETIPPGSEISISLDGFAALPGVDQTAQTPFVDYLTDDGSVASRIWLTTGEALRFRLDRLTPFGIAGAAFPDLLSAGLVNNVRDAILEYKIQLPSAASQQEMVLNWRIESAEGRVAEFTTGFNEELIVTLQAPDGNYAVNVDIVGGGLQSARGGAAVALFAPTDTPTPMPTETPEPTPTPTPTLAPVVAQQPAAPAAQPVAPPPGPGSIAVGNFEYGGHVANASSDRTINAMRSAGMTWKKVQVRYNLGRSAGDVAGTIDAMRAGGFRVLLGVVGSPAELAAGGGDYIRQYAQFVGDLAAMGVDAIEIWNEPNLSREWPEGQISGANYTALLRESYNAIKSRNGSVMVIAGAPAPTGAEAAFPGRVVNDDNFVRQMMEAGAINYMDCMGMHYNEGLVSARQTSGDPRDNYYTRYLPTLINMYWNLIGGQRPICITELGYLTPEGYGPLPEFFNWAANVTVAQQAAWLAEAAVVASQSGRVRLMIVWNIDFQRYDSDPMAGYAIIRPDGSCPACSALAGAR